MDDAVRSIIDLDIDESRCAHANDAVASETTSRRIDTLKLPPFWTSRPNLWFIQIESQFRIRAITKNNTKYDYLVSSLPTDIIELVSDSISDTPKINSYVKLRKLILSRSADSE